MYYNSTLTKQSSHNDKIFVSLVEGMFFNESLTPTKVELEILNTESLNETVPFSQDLQYVLEKSDRRKRGPSSREGEYKITGFYQCTKVD